MSGSARRLGLLTVVFGLLFLVGCRSGGLLSDVGVDRAVITPNGDGVDDVAHITYALANDARVSIWLVDASGRRVVLRSKLARTAGEYAAEFRGTQAEEDKELHRVLPNGQYTFTVLAEEDAGTRAEHSGQIVIQDADTEAPEVQDLTPSLGEISPNGDGIDDSTIVSYGISKRSEVAVYAIAPNERKYVLDPPRRRDPGLYSHEWNGTFGNAILPDGDYQVHVQAKDKAGNVTDRHVVVRLREGGTPRLEITAVEFSPKVVPIGGTLQVKIKVRNTGETPLRTLGPPPGTPFATNINWNYWTCKQGSTETPRYYERNGHWRVGVEWQLAGRPYPARWALTSPTRSDACGEEYPPLLPGEEAVITGTIQVLIDQTPEMDFWASVEQGGVGFPGGQKGRKTLRIGY